MTKSLQVPRKVQTHPCINRGRGKFDPEYRFPKFLREGAAPELRPDLGPCLIFTGSSNGNGYGQFTYNGSNGYAHRYAWERVNGQIPDGLTVDHLCMVRRCVRLEHLELVDGVTNFLRGRKAQTHCPNGHEYTRENSFPGKNGRQCRTCKVATSRREWERKRRLANGLPDRRVKFDQEKIREGLERYRRGEVSLSALAREIGCSNQYLSRRARGVTNGSEYKPKPKRTDAERQARKVVRARSGGICETCSAARATEWHHRKNRSQGGLWSADNGMHLCAPCHAYITDNPAESAENGWTVRSRNDPRLTPVVVHYRRRPVMLGEDGSVREATDKELIRAGVFGPYEYLNSEDMGGVA